MATLLLWRVITVTMLIFFLRQSRHLYPSELKSIEKDLRSAFATEDDTTYVVSNSDEDYDEDSDSDESDTQRHRDLHQQP